MKSMARSYFWWPGLDQDVEQYVKGCKLCMVHRPDPPKVPLTKWPDAKTPWERVHIDYLGPVKGKMFLVIVDSYTKWVEVFEMPNTDSNATTCKLREVFSRFGLPDCLVSDNGPQFTSALFSEFCAKNGIKHLTSAPFHPQGNGQAENSVKSFKTSFSKMLLDSTHQGKSVSTLIKSLFVSLS